MSFDGKANFAIAPVIVAPSPAVSGLTVTVLAGQGSLFTGTPPYNLTAWEPLPPLGQPTKAFAEIVRVEKVEGDTITFSARAQEGTTAKQIGPGWVIADTITVKALTDIEKAVEEGSTGLASEVAARQAGDSTNATAISNEKARAEGVEALKATIASLNAETVSRETADNLRLVKAENLKDLGSASTARTNLGLGSAAIEPSSAFDPKGAAATAEAAATTAVAAEKGRAETQEGLKLAKAENLKDVSSAPTARTNLGLGTAATEPSTAFDVKGAAASAQTAAEGVTATEKTRAEAAEALKAPLASPALTGTPTVPTATAGTNTTQAASTAFATTAKSEAESKGIPLTQKGAASGVAELTAGSKLPIAELPAPNAGGHYETNFGNGSASSFVIKHELKTLTPDISIVNQSTGLEEGCRKKVLNENEIELSATAWETTPPGSAAYRVSVDASSGLVATNGSVLTSYALKSEVGANSGIAPLEAAGKLPEARLPTSVVNRRAMASEGSVLDINTLYPEDFAVELGIKAGEDYSTVFQAITSFIRAEAASGKNSHFRVRLAEYYLLNGNPVTTLGGNSIWPFPNFGDTPCVIELLCAAGGTVLETTRSSDTYSAEHGPPSIIGGPTNEQLGINAHFSAARVVITGILQTTVPNNPAIGGQNWSRIGFLTADSLKDNAKNTASTEPTRPWAFGIYTPEGDNSSEVIIREIKVSGRFVGWVGNTAHVCPQMVNLFNNLLAFGLTGNMQYSGNDGHSAFLGYLQSQECKYHIASWSPVEGIISIPAGHQAQLVIGLWDIEDHNVAESAWYKTTAHLLDVNNQITGKANYGRVEGNVGLVSGALTVTGGSRFGLADITVGPYTQLIVQEGENKKQGAISLSGAAFPLSALTPATVAAGGSPYGLAISPDGKSVYVTGGAANTVLQYERNSETGKLTALSPISVSVEAEALSVTVSPDNKSVYVTNNTPGTVSQFSRNTETGQLTALSPATVATGSKPIGVAVSPDGKHAYIANEGASTLSQYERNSEGKLTALGTPTVTVGTNPRAVIVSPDGKHVYTANQNSENVSQLSRNSETGALTVLSPSTISAGKTPTHIAISSDGLSIYVANFASETVSQFSRNSETGKLTALSTPTVAAGSKPIKLAISPDGKSVYVTNEGGNTVSQYERNTETFLLSSLTPSTVAPGTAPVSVIVSPDNKNVYVTVKSGTKTVSQYERHLARIVSNTSITAVSRIFLTAQDNNSTGALRVTERNVGSSFTIASSNVADSGLVAYEIAEPAS